MSNPEASRQENRPFQLLIVDEDPVFRLGLRLWLNQFSDLEVVAEAETGSEALNNLAKPPETAPVESATTSSIAEVNLADLLDLIILDVGLGRTAPNQIQGLALCQQLRVRYPDLPILVLSSASEPVLQAAAQQAGANGYCSKGLEAAELVAVIRRVAGGGSWWVQSAPTATVSETTVLPVPRSASPPPSQQRSPAAPPRLPNAFTILRRNLRASGLQQIESALADVTAQLQNPDLSLLDRAILAGQHRELRASHWLVRQLLATPRFPDEANIPPEPTASTPLQNPPYRPASGDNDSIAAGQPSEPVEPTAGLVPLETGAIANTQNLQSVLFDNLLTKLQNGLENQTEVPLETDILREDRKRELFYLVLRKLEDLLDELRYSQVQPEQLPQKRSLLLLDLWRAVTTDFLGRYYTVEVRGQPVEVVSVLLQDADIVETGILNDIPFVTDLLSHLLFRTPLLVNSAAYPVGNPESVARAELLLDNLIIQVANAVIQPLLNRFANVDMIKDSFYNRRLLSSREIERFRNNLSWKYRVERLFSNPKYIFESQYPLFALLGRGIKKTTIYAPRTQELESLSGLQLAVTLMLETRDAIAPRLRSTVTFVGNGIIYVLTEVVGRGIGLVGRGILKGLGNAWQDTRSNRK